MNYFSSIWTLRVHRRNTKYCAKCRTRKRYNQL